MVDLIGPIVRAKYRRRRDQFGLTDELCDRALDTLPEILSGKGPLPLRQVMTALADRDVHIDTSDQAPTHLMLLAATHGLVCRGPEAGRLPTFALTGGWLTRGPRLDRDESLIRLARMYLASRPAAVRGFRHMPALPAADVPPRIRTPRVRTGAGRRRRNTTGGARRYRPHSPACDAGPPHRDVGRVPAEPPSPQLDPGPRCRRPHSRRRRDSGGAGWSMDAWRDSGAFREAAVVANSSSKRSSNSPMQPGGQSAQRLMTSADSSASVSRHRSRPDAVSSRAATFAQRRSSGGRCRQEVSARRSRPRWRAARCRPSWTGVHRDDVAVDVDAPIAMGRSDGPLARRVPLGQW